MAYLMKCGHVSNAIDSNNKPVCGICIGMKKEHEEIEKLCIGNEGLEGRKAKCSFCSKTVDSKWDLPFFEYSPNEEYDNYCCGCCGWD
jgi:hypothetical protein